MARAARTSDESESRIYMSIGVILGEPPNPSRLVPCRRPPLLAREHVGMIFLWSSQPCARRLSLCHLLGGPRRGKQCTGGPSLLARVDTNPTIQEAFPRSMDRVHRPVSARCGGCGRFVRFSCGSALDCLSARHRSRARER